MAEDRRRRVVRNLMSEFNAASQPSDNRDPKPPVNGDPNPNPPDNGELAEDAEEVLPGRVDEAERQRFIERWGFDVLLDRPVEGGGWEYEQIYPPPAPPEQVADRDAPREP